MKQIEITLRENEEKVLPLLWTLGSGEINVSARLAGRGAKLSIFGAVLLSNQDNLAININIKHDAADTFSNTLIKSVLSERSQGKFSGLVEIHKGAKNTDAYFREDALLLSKTAKAEAIPSLEIDENEVKAGHASTVGPIDPEQMFYLMSKGINQEQAKAMIVRGYLSVVMDRVPKTGKEKLLSFLESRFKV